MSLDVQCKRATYRVSPLEGSPYVSKTSSRTGFRRFQAPEAARRLLGRAGSDDFMVLAVGFGRPGEGDRRSSNVENLDYHGCRSPNRFQTHSAQAGSSEGNRAGGSGRWDGGAAPELDASQTIIVTTGTQRSRRLNVAERV